MLLLGLLLTDIAASGLFKLGWTRNITSPFDPLALGVVAPHKQVDLKKLLFVGFALDFR